MCQDCSWLHPLNTSLKQFLLWQSGARQRLNFVNLTTDRALMKFHGVLKWEGFLQRTWTNKIEWGGLLELKYHSMRCEQLSHSTTACSTRATSCAYPHWCQIMTQCICCTATCDDSEHSPKQPSPDRQGWCTDSMHTIFIHPSLSIQHTFNPFHVYMYISAGGLKDSPPV